MGGQYPRVRGDATAGCGNAAANDVADHKSVLAAALRQLPLPIWSKLLIRIDGAAFSHALLEHLQALTTSRRRVRWVTGWAINTADERAIALLPEQVWTCALRQDGQVHEIKGPDGEWLSYQVAELTGVRDLTGWPKRMRLIVRRVKPSRRDAKKLTAFEKRTGWRYQIIATNIPAHHGLSGVPASGQMWFVDALYRDHAEVEDRVKAIKRVGLALLPSKSWQLNAAWILAAALAADLDAWMRLLLLLHDEPELAMPAAAPSTSTAPGPGRPRSPPPGSAPPNSRPPPDGWSPPRRGPGRRRPAPPSGPWNPTPPQRHATAHPDTARDITGRQPPMARPSRRRTIEVNARHMTCARCNTTNQNMLLHTHTRSCTSENDPFPTPPRAGDRH
ncbi:transposase [Streptomyces sp. NPDC005708]|uniref:transposase n=1 Tax=Streptomyces sp. NPDC005708 TaxID=3154564 RepID=UPI0033D693DA